MAKAKAPAKRAPKQRAEVRYSAEITARICAEVAAGESVKEVCRQAWAPNEKTHYRWMAAYPEYRDAITAARATGIERHADEIIAIADGAASALVDDTGKPILHDGQPVLMPSNEATNHARLKIDARKWIMAKLLPKKYGDKVEHEHSGGVTVEVVRFGDQGPAAS